MPSPEPTIPPDPWRRLSSTERYRSPFIVVRDDEVVRPDGQPATYGVVSFRNLALGVVPLFADGDTVLVGQHRYPLDAWSWEIPEGGGDPEAEPLEEVARELAEETGLRAGRWSELGRLHTSNSVTDEVALLWLAEDLAEGEADPDGTEELVSWRLPLEEAVAMALDGRITDALSVAGLCRAAALLRVRGGGAAS